MKKYVIYTENKNQDKIISILQYNNLDFSLFMGTGSFENKIEKSLKIEIFSHKTLSPKLIKIIKEINRVNRQNCSLLVYSQVNADFIS